MTEMAMNTNIIDPVLIPSLNGPPYELFDQWRANDPIHWNPPNPDYESPMPEASLSQGFYVLTRYQDVFDVSRNQALFTSHDGSPVIWDFEPEALARQQAGMMGMKPEQHGAVKRLVVPYFGPKQLEPFYPEIDNVAAEILDSVAAKGGCEFVFDVASRLPVYTFCKIMGIPDDLRETVFTLGNALADTENPQNRGHEQSPAMLELFQVAQNLAEEKRNNPDNSMFSQVVNGEVNGEKLDEMNLNMFFMTISIAGHETTRNTAAHFIRLMQEFPDQFSLLQSDVDRYLPNAIEEVLRHSPPVINFRRTVTEDTELGSVSLKKGDKVYLSYPAANRDPEIFDDPHRFDITRENANKHLSFGTGPHVCLGARLARYQLAALLKQIITRIPDIHPVGEKEMLNSIWFNAILKMPVEFTPEGVGSGV
ncbi:MAG: cytochrome P450 [Gammaproteobacteria bacterium]|nr:cytochrome P450 [Gammaproteobacteria bacterium]